MNGGERVSTAYLSAGMALAAGGGTGTARETALQPAACSSRSSTAPVPVPPSQQQGMGMAGDWPLESYLELGPFPSAVPCVRAHAKQMLWEWGLTEFSDRVELLVTELATNAVRASQLLTPVHPIRFWLRSDKLRVVVMIWDASPQSPVRVDVDDEAESGRGLLLVEAVSDQWGWYAPSDGGGKVVWCEVSEDGPPEVAGERRSEGG